MKPRLLEFLDRISRNCSESWLSPTQKSLYQKIQEVINFNDTINIYGNPGVGKTFLTWILSKNAEISCCAYRHTQTDYLSKALERLVIIDPHVDERKLVRATLAKLHDVGYNKVVLVSQKPLPDQIPSYNLTLYPEDYEYIYAKWQNANIPIDELGKNLNSNLHITLRNLALLYLEK